MERGIFNNLRNLEELKLYDLDQLVELDKDLLKDLQSLEYLHVGFNEQVKLEADLIMYLPALKKIHLDENQVRIKSFLKQLNKI